MEHDFPILYVEDEEYDILFLKRAFNKAEIKNPIEVATDGQEAIDYLTGTGVFADRQQHPLPGLVMLDLKLPRKSGLDVLRWIRSQPELKQLLVLIFTSSSQRKDIESAYSLGANGYIVKQGDPDLLAKMASAIREYWLRFNEPPFSPPCGISPSPEEALSPI